MRIEVRLYATLRRHAPAAHSGVLSAELPTASTVADLIRLTKIAPDEVHMVMVNGVNVTLTRVLGDGDRVGLFPPVGGG